MFQEESPNCAIFVLLGLNGHCAEILPHILTVVVFSLHSHPFRLLCDTVAAHCLSGEGSDQDHQEQQKPRLE